MTHQHGRPAGLTWDYDRAEMVVDGIVHGIGVVLGVAGAVVLIALALRSPGLGDVSAAGVYALGLVAMLAISATYNLWPVSRVKWVLRRFDHSAIYLLIAATYTPFIARLKDGALAFGVLTGVWATALVGIALKLALPGRFDRLSIALYLLLGWSGVMMYQPVSAALPAMALWLIGAGGLLYTCGVVFHVWESLRFQNAIWHGFVVLAAGCHYAAVLASLGAV
jgi:hemolysin III